jgi:glycosyltransferase involved in cell wall biosynthesis
MKRIKKNKVFYNVFIDNRWSGDHGIGQVSKNLKKYLNASPLNVPCKKFSIFNYFVMFFLIRKLPNDSIVINPGFNNPIVHLKNYFFYIHDVVHIDFYNSFFYKLFYLHIKLFYRNSIFFTVSEFSKSRIQQRLGFKASNIFVVKNGIDDDFFRLIPNNYSLNKKYFLCVGNRKKHKNELMVLDAFSLLSKKMDYDLVFIGNESKSYIKKINELRLNNKVWFLKNLSQTKMINLYRNASAFICPSLYEGFSLTVVEAMASKIPVFASDIEVHREITGGNVLFFNPYKYKDLYNTINQNLHSYPIDLKNNAYLFSKRYTWQKFSLKILKIIEGSS